MAIYKTCIRCGKQIKSSERCSCIKQRYLNEEEDEYKQFYKGKLWKKTKEIAIKKYAGIDIYSFFIENYLEYGFTLQHIIPLKECWEKRADLNNLIFLTESNHRKIHKIMEKGGNEREKMIQTLLDLVKKYEKEISK